MTDESRQGMFKRLGDLIGAVALALLCFLGLMIWNMNTAQTRLITLVEGFADRLTSLETRVDERSWSRDQGLANERRTNEAHKRLNIKDVLDERQSLHIAELQRAVDALQRAVQTIGDVGFYDGKGQD